MIFSNPRGPAHDYIKRREARRKGRDVQRRAEMDRHIQAIRDQKKRKYYSNPKPPHRRRWWQFWKRSKARTEGWD